MEKKDIEKENTKRFIIAIIILTFIATFFLFVFLSIDFDNSEYIEDLKEQINRKDEEIKELKDHNSSQYEERLNSIESYLDEIGYQVDAIYEQVVPESKKNENVFTFTE